MIRAHDSWTGVPPDSRAAESSSALCSEDAVLALIDRCFPRASGHSPRGRGHDCAELSLPGADLALSTDMFWEGSHFRRTYFTPAEAGAKALTVAVSDLAAAGARPLGFSLALLLPPDLQASALEAALRGMADAAAGYGIALTGGDLARGDRLGFSLTVWGSPSDGAKGFLRRDRPRPGDILFLVGDCGLARVGLWALERQGRQALRDWPEACAAHLAPRARIAAGQRLALLACEAGGLPGDKDPAADDPQDRGPARISLMDVSDGLARDLPRLLGELGADLDFDPGLIPRECLRAAPAMGADPDRARDSGTGSDWGQIATNLFLLGGEDYALLGSCPAPLWAAVREALPDARRLGLVRLEPGLFREGIRLELGGFDHFSAPAPPCPRSVPSGSGPVSAPYNDAAFRIIRCGREAWQAGLMAGFNGNISCRVSPPWPETAEICLITRSGAAKARLVPEDMAALPLDGGSLSQDRPTSVQTCQDRTNWDTGGENAGGDQPGCRKASSESPLHLAIYRACPKSRAILHIHPPYLSALSLAFEPEQRLCLPMPEAECYRARLAWTPFFPPGSADLARAVAEAAARHPAVWMERHGLVVHGPDLDFALALSEELEQLAKIQLATIQPAKV